MKFTLALLLLLSSAGLPAQMPGNGPLDALDGLDPVLLVQGKEVPGKSALNLVRGRFNYLFSTPETRATFEREPAKYEIQFGGMCARMGKTAGGNPSDFVVHDGKIYIFGSDDCHKRFQEAPQKYLPPTPAVFPTTRDAATQGRQLIDAMIRGLGSANRIDALTSYVEAVAQVQKRPDGDVPVTTKTMWLFPDRVRQERSMTRQGKTMSSSLVFAPDGMWFVGGGGQVYPTPEPARPSQQQEFGRHPIALLRARSETGFKAAALGSTTIEGVKVQQVRIVNGPVDVIVRLDQDRHLHSVSFVDRSNGEGTYGTHTLYYSDFRDVDGLKLPFAVRGTFDGQPEPFETWTVQSVQLNAPLEKSLFAPKADGAK